MRIIGGTYRHRVIKWPDDKNIRPTKDRIREAIFNALGPIDNYAALDLYAGSGAMGLEALSRNASYVTFVDINKTALSTVKENVESLNIPASQYSIIAKKDVDALAELSNKNKQFDLIFLDPPYAEGKYKEIIDILFAKNLIKDNTIMVLESDYEIKLDRENYKKVREYHYGEIHVLILWR